MIDIISNKIKGRSSPSVARRLMTLVARRALYMSRAIPSGFARASRSRWPHPIKQLNRRELCALAPAVGSWQPSDGSL